MTGIDLSAGSLARARPSPAVLRFVARDMRRRSAAGRSTRVQPLHEFRLLRQPLDQLTVIRNIAVSLKPGGTLVLDYLNVRHAERHLVRE